ncbi:MAG: hypothetical protein Q8M16_15525, partial [Pirellulaceae bacterium]|nr:hypothetical protein [Pirellulaceae bacterium]
MTSADGHAGSLGDSSTGTPARGLRHGDSSTHSFVLVSNMNPSAVGADGLLCSSVSGNGHSLPLSQSAIGRGVQVWLVAAAAVLFFAVAAKLQWI